jgi:hypothetical protein
MTHSDFDEFAKLFKRAEEKVKIIEALTDELAIPAINELRYAGFHAVQAHAEQNDTERRDKIERGIRHCERAIYDSTEIGVAYYLAEILLFQNDYRLVPIISVIPDYLDCLGEIRAAQGFLCKNSLHDPDYDWKTCEKHFATLRDIVFRFDNARPELNKVLRDWRIRTWIAIGVLLAMVAGLYLTLLLSI